MSKEITRPWVSDNYEKGGEIDRQTDRQTDRERERKPTKLIRLGGLGSCTRSSLQMGELEVWRTSTRKCATGNVS